MAIIADSGGVYALYDKSDFTHAEVRAAVLEENEQLIIPSVVLGEIDYLLRARIGTHALIQFLSDIAAGGFRIEDTTTEDLRRCRELLRKYTDLDLGLCDAAVVATAERLGLERILTVDQRDFRVIRSSQGKPFVLLPADRKKKGKK